MKVLVTGAAGFIGRAVMARLRADGACTAIGVDVVDVPGVEIRGDLNDGATLDACFASRMDAVITSRPGPVASQSANRSVRGP